MTSPPLTSSTKGAQMKKSSQEQRAVQLSRSDGILGAAARASLILPFLVRFRSRCLIAVILSGLHVARERISDRFWSDPPTGNNQRCFASLNMTPPFMRWALATRARLQLYGCFPRH